MSGATGARLTLLGREGCGLCEEFLEALAAECPEALPRLEVADVDSRPGWAGRYGLVIPVLLDDEDGVLCETFFAAEPLRAWLARRPG